METPNNDSASEVATTSDKEVKAGTQKTFTEDQVNALIAKRVN